MSEKEAFQGGLSTRLQQYWFRVKQEGIALRLTHTLRERYSDDQPPFPPASPPHSFVL